MKQRLAFISDDRGVVALVVTVIIMLILTITTLGMATIARREQRQTLDRLLATEAFFAAESGVNDAIKYHQANPTTSVNDCSTASVQSINQTPARFEDPTGGGLPATPGPQKNVLILPSSASGVLGALTTTSEYSCVLVNNQPTSLDYSQVTTDNSIVTSFLVKKPGTGLPDNANHLVIAWEDYQTNNPTYRSGCPSTPFLSSTSWGASGPMLRVDVTTLDTPNNRAALAANTATYYFYPCASGPQNVPTPIFQNSLGYSNSGTIVPTNCDTSAVHVKTLLRPLHCVVSIGFNPVASNPSGFQNLLVRIKPIYKDARISILAFDCSSAPGTECLLAPATVAQALAGGQTSLDVTGRADTRDSSGNILSAGQVKRIKVNISDNTTPYLNAVDTAGPVCKRLRIYPGYADYDQQNVAAALDKALCNPVLP